MLLAGEATVDCSALVIQFMAFHQPVNYFCEKVNLVVFIHLPSAGL